MSIYQKIASIGSKVFPKHILFKYGFNFSPMYRRTTGKIVFVSRDLHKIIIKLPLSWKNKNYVNSIFGGSLFAAVDPIPMVQLINLLGPDYIVWDKSATIQFRRPAKDTVWGNFVFTPQELLEIKTKVQEEKEIEWIKSTTLTNKEKDKIFCRVDKTLYVADKDFYKQKRKQASG